jgi:hypothetical protein
MAATVPHSVDTRTSGRSILSLDLTAVRTVPRRRWLQLALGLIWLVDAALQYQPYMFGRDFVTQTIEPAAAGTPYLVQHPSIWAAHFMLHHIAFYNSLFATIQLLIALALFWRPAVRIGLAVSIVWALAIWWLAEGIGGITLGATAVMGAPGAVVLYALIALLVWPRHRDDENRLEGSGGSPASGGSATGASVASDGSATGDGSVAASGLLGPVAPRALWAIMWIGLVALGLENVNRSPSALASSIAGMSDGEPAWIRAMNRGLVTPLLHHGTEWSIALSILMGFVALGVLARPTVRPALVLAVILGVAFWLAQDFGGIFTGSATDVNSGPLLVLLAATLWPALRRSPGTADTIPVR